MGKDVPPPCDRQPLPEIDRLAAVIPNPVGVRITAVHFGVRELPDRDPVAKGEYDSGGYS